MIGALLALHPPASPELVAAVESARAAMRDGKPMPATRGGLYDVVDGTAIVSIVGFMAKATSPLDRLILHFLGGTDTALALAAVEAAGQAPDVAAVLLHVNSPGGVVAGTDDLARGVAELRGRKPVIAFIEDLGASAAYHVASQADRIAVNPAGFVGSIGVYSVLLDASGALEAAGLKVHVVRSTELKGAGVIGAPITDPQLAEAQRLVDGMATQFIEAVARGRGVPVERARTWADGRLQFAQDARRLGLVDGIGTFDQALAAARVGPQDGGMSRAGRPVAREEERKSMTTTTTSAGARSAFEEATERARVLVRDGQARTFAEGLSEVWRRDPELWARHDLERDRCSA
jgi:signal peptide peptidase SppA